MLFDEIRVVTKLRIFFLQLWAVPLPTYQLLDPLEKFFFQKLIGCLQWSWYVPIILIFGNRFWFSWVSIKNMEIFNFLRKTIQGWGKSVAPLNLSKILIYQINPIHFLLSKITTPIYFLSNKTKCISCLVQ